MNIDTTVIVKEVSTDLARKLKDLGENVSTNTLNLIVKATVRELIQRREYPESMSEEAILADLENYYSTLIHVSEYDYNLIGAEGQSSHSENGVTRKFVDRDSLFDNVYKFVRFI